jgi:indolepyruvate ferredoxin oxidoreductase alpha subunit
MVLLENGTTAMTGHQPRAGSGEVGDRINLTQLFETLGAKFIRDVDAYHQTQLTQHVREALDHRGFAVVIARHPCMLKFVRQRRAQAGGFKPRQVQVNQERCDRLRVCVSEFGCPSFIANDDGRITVHPDLCIGDGSCMPTCPVEAIDRPQSGDQK